MERPETMNGVPVTDEQIAEWAEEAEAGYDLAALRHVVADDPAGVPSHLRSSP